MKKTLTLLMLCVVIAATSCKKETIVEPSANTQTFIYDLTADDWKQTTDNISYIAKLEAPAIDDYLQHNGAVLVYISFDSGQTYEQVPETFDKVAYSFSHRTGSIEILAQAYDGALPAITQPGNATVKVVLIDSDL